MRRDNLLRESASRGWSRVLFESRFSIPEADARQGTKYDFRYLDTRPAQSQVSLEATGTKRALGKTMWPEASVTAGLPHRFPFESVARETTSVVPARRGPLSEALPQLGLLPSSLLSEKDVP